MSTTLRLAIPGMLLSFVICGCQSPSSKWAMTSKAAPQTKGAAKSEDREAWPPKSSKSSESIAKSTGSKSDPVGKTTEHVRDSAQLSELLEKGDRYRKSGLYEEARMTYTGALAVSPNSPDVNHRLAIIADKQQQFSLADQFYQTALRSRPKDPNLLSDLGYSYSLRGNAKQAEKTLKQALAIEPNHRGAMANLGTLYAQQNRYEDALAMFRKGSPTESEARQNMAKLFPDAEASDSVASDSHEDGASPLMASTPPEKINDVAQMSVEQLRAELARRDGADKPGKSRGKSWDEGDAETDKLEQFQTQLQRTAQRDLDKNPAEGSRRTDTPRSLADPQVVQVGGQAHDDGTNGHRSAGNPAHSSRLATRIGMSCGPGNLFPIVNGSDQEDAPVSQGTTSQQESRYRSPLDDASRSALPVNGLSSPGTKKSDEIAKATFTQNGADPAAATGGVKPAVASSRLPSWRDQLQDSVSWDSDTRDFDDTSTETSSKKSAGLIKSGAALPGDRLRGETDSFAGVRSSTDNGRPYSGNWPKSNDIPSRSKSTAASKNTVLDNVERVSVNLGGAEEPSPRTGNGTGSILSTRPPSNWPDGPNR